MTLMAENEWDEIRSLQRVNFSVVDGASASHRHAFIHVFDSTHPVVQNTILEEFLAHADYDCCHNTLHNFLTYLPFPLACYDLIFVYVDSVDLAKALLAQSSAALDRIPSSTAIVFAVASDVPTYSFPRDDRIAFITTSHVQSSSPSAHEPLASCLVRCVASATEDEQTVNAEEVESRSNGALRLVGTPAAQISRQAVWGQFGMSVAFRCIVSCAVGLHTYAPKDVVGGLLKRLLAASTVQNIPLHTGRLLVVLRAAPSVSRDGSGTTTGRMNDHVEQVAGVLRDATVAASTSGGDVTSMLSPDIQVLRQGECVVVSVSMPMMEAQAQLLVDFAAERVAADAQLRRLLVEMRVAHSFEVLSTIRLFLLLQALAHKRSVDAELRLCVESVCSWQFLHSDTANLRDASQPRLSVASNIANTRPNSRSPPPPSSPPLPVAANTQGGPLRPMGTNGKPFPAEVRPNQKGDPHRRSATERGENQSMVFNLSEMQLRALVDEAVNNKVAFAFKENNERIERMLLQQQQQMQRGVSRDRAPLERSGSAAADANSNSKSYQNVREEMNQLQRHSLEAFSHYGDRLDEIEEGLAALAESSMEGTSAVEKHVDHVALSLEALQRKLSSMDRSIQEKDHRLVLQEDRLTVVEAAARASGWHPSEAGEREQRAHSHRSPSLTPSRVAGPNSSMLLKIRKELLEEQERSVAEIDELKKRMRDFVTTAEVERCRTRIEDLEMWRADSKKAAGDDAAAKQLASEMPASVDLNRGIETDGKVTLHSLHAEMSALREDVSAIQVEFDLSNVPELRQRLSQLSDDVALSLEAMRRDFAQSFAESKVAADSQKPAPAGSTSAVVRYGDALQIDRSRHDGANPDDGEHPLPESSSSLSFIAERIRALEMAAEEVTSRTADFHDTVQITVDSLHEQVASVAAAEAQLELRVHRFDDALLANSEREDAKRVELKRRMQRDLDVLVDGVNGIVEEVVHALQERTEDQLEQTRNGVRVCVVKSVEGMVRWMVQDCGLSATSESVGMLLLRIEQLLEDNLSSVPYTYMTPQRANAKGDGGRVPEETERPNGLVSPSPDSDDADNYAHTRQ